MPAVERLVGRILAEDSIGLLDHKIKGTTALRVAGENNNEEVVKYLLRNGAVDYGKLSGDKLNKLMMWWGEVERESATRASIVVEQIFDRDPYGRNI